MTQAIMRDRTIKVVSWNIAKKRQPWFELAELARQGEADLALLQEAGKPPAEIADRFRYENDVLGACRNWHRNVRIFALRDDVSRFRHGGHRAAVGGATAVQQSILA